MSGPARKARSNPFYVLLLLASTAFVVTALAYYVSPIVAQQAAERKDGPAGTPPLVDWLDRRGPAALGVEFALMLVAGLLAMATDSKFAASKRPGAGPS